MKEFSKEIEEHFTYLGEIALLAYVNGDLRYDQATDGLLRRRMELLGEETDLL